MRFGSSAKWVHVTALSIWHSTKYVDTKDTKAAAGLQKTVTTHAIKGKEMCIDLLLVQAQTRKYTS